MHYSFTSHVSRHARNAFHLISLSNEWYLLLKDICDDSFIHLNSREGLSDRFKGAQRCIARTPAASMPTKIAPARDSALSPTDGQVSFFRRPMRCLGNCGERESCLPIRTERILPFSDSLSKRRDTPFYRLCFRSGRTFIFSWLHINYWII